MTRIPLLPRDDDRCGWVKALPPRPRPVTRVAGKVDVDWAIVGAGYTGLAAARRLAEIAPGRSVAVIEAGRAGEGAAGRNSGFAVEISPSPRKRVDSPEAAYRRAVQINQHGLAILERTIRAEGIACDWSPIGKHQCAAEPRHFERLDRFAEHLAVLGLPHRRLDGDELRARLGTPHYKRGVHTAGTVLVQPAALSRGLAMTLPAAVTLFEESPVLALETTGAIRLTCAGGTVRAGRLILATNAYLPLFGAFRNRLISFTLTNALTRPLSDDEHRALGAPEPWGVISIHRFGATVRYTADRRIMLRNTFEYWPQMAMTPEALHQRQAIAESALRARFPMLPDLTIEHFWSGVICASRNLTAAFGEIAPGVHAAGCCNAGGIARGTALGTLIADQAVGVGSPLLDAVRAIAPPAWVPPRPFLDLAVAIDLKRRRRGLGAEL
jgi:glycine/D-amino acid oxidase-like deaminating enzyme